MGKTAPPFSETVAKYCKDSGKDVETVTAAITAYAKQLALKNLDVVAYVWVTNQGGAPPAIKQSSAPFTTLDKPYLLLNDIGKGDLKIGENTGFNIRGFVFGWREQIVKSSKKEMTVVTLGDESGGVQDILYFGEQALTVRTKKIDLGDPVFIKNAQLRFKGSDWSIQVSGPFATTEKMATIPVELDIKKFPSYPLKDLKVDESRFVRALVWNTDQNPYAGCPRCKRKFKENVPFGRQAECPGNPEKNIPSCGVVESKRLTWTTLHINDDDGEAKLRFGPDFPFTEEQLAALKMKQVIAVGSLNDRDDFEVSWFSPVDALGNMPVSPVASPAVDLGTHLVDQPVMTVTAGPINVTTNVVASTSTPAPASAAKLNIPNTIMSYLRFFGAKKTEDLVELVLKKGVPRGDVEIALMALMEEKKIIKDDTTGLVRLA